MAIKSSLLLILFMITSSLFAQIKFEKGYMIFNNGQRSECFIKNLDWNNNPIEFEYKLSENSESKIANIQTIKEFGVYNFSRYKRYTLQIDRSGEKINNFSYKRNPIWSEETLFLKVLVDGEISLYEFKDSDNTRYFYDAQDKNIEQLIYKEYLVDGNSKIAENNHFQQQLKINFPCEKISVKNYANIDYDKRDLSKYFLEYNACKNNTVVNYNTDENKKSINLYVKAGLNFPNLTLQFDQINRQPEKFESKIGYRFGIELEYMLSFNKDKFSLFVEPTFQHSESKQTPQINQSGYNYSYLEIPLGFRTYFFLNDKNKIHLEAYYVIDFEIESNVEPRGYIPEEFGNTSALGFGLGYNFNNYNLQFRYTKDLNKKTFFSTLKYDAFSIVFGYKFL